MTEILEPRKPGMRLYFEPIKDMFKYPVTNSCAIKSCIYDPILAILDKSYSDDSIRNYNYYHELMIMMKDETLSKMLYYASLKNDFIIELGTTTPLTTSAGSFKYRYGQKITVSSKNHHFEKAAFIHELNHKIAYDIFNNSAKPFTYQDEESYSSSYSFTLKNKFENVVDELHVNIFKFLSSLTYIDGVGNVSSFETFSSSLNSINEKCKFEQNNNGIESIFQYVFDFLGYDNQSELTQFERGKLISDTIISTDLFQYMGVSETSQCIIKSLLFIAQIYLQYDSSKEYIELFVKYPEILAGDCYDDPTIKNILEPLKYYHDTEVVPLVDSLINQLDTSSICAAQSLTSLFNV